MMPEVLEKKSTPTAAIIVIGDEILKGQIQDTNTFFLTQELKACGVKVNRVLVIPDDIEEISLEVKDLCSRFTYVFTCGGVGPTHDDVTFESVAKAFSQELIISPEIKDVLEMHFKGGELNSSMLKMAKVPSEAKVDYSVTGTNSFPVITLKNLFIFPGVPKLLQKCFKAIRPILYEAHASKHKATVKEAYIKSTEFVITEQLNNLVKEYQKDVTFGSYPSWDNNYYETKLTIEADEEKIVDEVVAKIRSSMDVVELDLFPMADCEAKLQKFITDQSKDPAFHEQLKGAQNVIRECYETYKPEEVAIAFNGGKDCMVMLHLTFVHRKSRGLMNQKLKALYIRDSDPFPKVEEFISTGAKLYNLDLITIQKPMKEALTEMLKDNPIVKATLMGTRMGDPGSSYQAHFSPTDGDWPKVMRVNPILNWEYYQVWNFLRGLFLPYPVLYDQGYTSLGGKSNTDPNPNLSYKSDNGIEKFKPAYELKDGSQERAGRRKR